MPKPGEGSGVQGARRGRSVPTPARAAAGSPLVVVYAAVALDAVGIGLIFPILPRLLQEIARTDDIAPYVGLATALYAAMQLVFAPVLGALSDRLGRRPVLLVSMAGASIDYVVMAFAPHLWLLLLGRAVAGVTSANVAVATAYITDVSPEESRARRFGLFSAMMGIGFIVGPVLGGVLGDHWLRLPFLAAALLNGANLLVAWLALPETHRPTRAPLDLAALNPLRPLRWAWSTRGLLPIAGVYFLLSGVGEAYGTCWALWGHDAFRWDGLWIGLSLGAFGISQTLVQALLPGVAARWLGERWTVIAGIACTCLALLALAFAGQGWMVFALVPGFALGGIGTPAFQALATRKVEPGHQGQLQGVLASTVGLASVIAPLAFSAFYSVFRARWPGAIWLVVMAVNLLAIPMVLLSTRPRGHVSAGRNGVP